LNNVVLIGRLTDDPELRSTQSGIAVAQFRLAVQRRFANQQGVREADFIPVVVWKQQAENCAKFLKKGSRAGVTGVLQTRSYTAQDGTKRYVTEVVADFVEFLSSKQEGGAQASLEAMAPPAQARDAGGFSELDDEELPF